MKSLSTALECPSDDSNENYNLYLIMLSSKSLRLIVMLVSECTLQEHWPKFNLLPSRVKLHSYSAESVSMLGTEGMVV